LDTNKSFYTTEYEFGYSTLSVDKYVHLLGKLRQVTSMEEKDGYTLKQLTLEVMGNNK